MSYVLGIIYRQSKLNAYQSSAAGGARDKYQQSILAEKTIMNGSHLTEQEASQRRSTYKRISRIYIDRYPHLAQLIGHPKEFARNATRLAAPAGVTALEVFELAGIAETGIPR